MEPTATPNIADVTRDNHWGKDWHLERTGVFDVPDSWEVQHGYTHYAVYKSANNCRADYVFHSPTNAWHLGAN